MPDASVAGGWTNAANSWHAHFARSDVGVAITTAAGGLVLAPEAGAGVAPVVDQVAGVVVYPGVWPGVDVRFQVTGAGVEESLMIGSRSAGSSFEFAVSGGTSGAATKQLSGATAAVAASGIGPAVLQPGPAGSLVSAVAVLGQPLVLDRNGNGLGQAHAQLTSANGTLQLSLDPAWLAAQPDSAFPIDLDPSINPGPTNLGAYKSDGTSCSSCPIQFGNPNDSGTSYWRSVGFFDYQSLFGDHVTGAELETGWQGGTQNQYGVKVYWASAYSYAGAAHGAALASGSPGATGAAISGAALTSQIASWVATRKVGGALGFVGTETAQSYTYQQFHMTLYVTFTRPPTLPTGVGWTSPMVSCVTGSASPTVDGTKAMTWQATVSSPDGRNVSGQFLWWDTANAAVTHPANTGVVASGHKVSVSFNSGVFADGHTYEWKVRGSDGTLTSVYTGGCEFKVQDPPPNLPASPAFASPAAACLSGGTVAAVRGDQPITVQAKVSDPDGKPVTANVRVLNTASTTQTLWSQSLSTYVSSGTVITATIPANTLADKAAFTWQIQASNGQKTSAWTAGCSATVDDTLPVAPVPTSTDFGLPASPAGTVGVIGAVTLPAQTGVDHYVWSLSPIPTGDLPGCGQTDPASGASEVCASAGAGWLNVAVEPEAATFQVFAVGYSAANTPSMQGSAQFAVNEIGLSAPTHSWLTDTADVSNPAQLPVSVADAIDPGNAIPNPNPALAVTANADGSDSWVVDGQFGAGPALHLDGSAGYAATPAPVVGASTLDLTRSLSLLAYVRAGAATAPLQTIASQDGSTASATALQTDTAGHLQFCLESTDSGSGTPTWDCASSSVAPAQGQWQSVLGIWDQPAHQLRLYLGGNLIASSGHLGSAAVDGAFAVGRGLSHGAPASLWQGDIGDPTSYPGVLDPNQIQLLDQYGLPFDPANQ
ncbi:MAG: LamG domain-containing protein [Actinomycetota bacterium]|nr:LamG domain-containing protein [Actinomycetota bacterium]MDQ2955928.1 LamG domain-containing protein [Actinomycetota bacterium]